MPPLPLIASKAIAASLNVYLLPETATLPLIASGPNPLPAGIGRPAQAARLRTDGMARSASPSSLIVGAPTPDPAKAKLIGVDASLTLIGVGRPPSNAAGRSMARSRLTVWPFHAAEPDADIGLSMPGSAKLMLIALAGARVGIAHAAVLDLEMGEAQPREFGHRAGAAAGGRGRGGCGHSRRRSRRMLEPPVWATILADLEGDHRIDQDETVDRDRAAQQRQQLQPDLERLELRHVLRDAARRVAEGHLVGGQLDLRQQMEAHRAVDAQSAAGRLLDRRDELRLVGVDRNHERRDERRDDDQNDDDGDGNQQLFHAASHGARRANVLRKRCTRARAAY